MAAYPEPKLRPSAAWRDCVVGAGPSIAFRVVLAVALRTPYSSGNCVSAASRAGASVQNRWGHGSPRWLSTDARLPVASCLRRCSYKMDKTCRKERVCSGTFYSDASRLHLDTLDAILTTASASGVCRYSLMLNGSNLVKMRDHTTNTNAESAVVNA